MGPTNFILNLAGLLLWFNWRSLGFDPLGKTTAATLVGTLRRAEPRRLKRWHLLAALGVLLLLRALLYWQLGPAVDWTPHFHLPGIDIAIPFRSDNWWRMVLFSGLSFAALLAACYLWLLLFSIVNGRKSDGGSLQRMVRSHLGRVDRWPWAVKLLLPLLVGLVCWYLLNLLLARLGILPSAHSRIHRVEQAAVVGLGSYLSWRYLIGGVLALHLVASYVYLGNQPFWSFVTYTGRNLLRPLRRVPLRLAKVDFAPLMEMALVFLLAELAERGLTELYQRLPL
ncbi:MAG TPA: hypothetical protein VMU04_06195 [Candidatus Acidoferrum sp.]|nr:hypothetical protein [Candidatus Acidoferrum sp.]